LKSARVSKIFAPTISLCLFSSPLMVGLTQAFAQAPDFEIRTRTIVASFNKKKHVVKEKYGFRKESYKEIRCGPVIKQELKDYSGTYEVSDLGYSINLQVARDGKIEVNGYEPATLDSTSGRQFTFRGARIEGALLTATKVYSDGAVEKFEGIFINRTEFNSPTDSGVSTFGLGVAGTPIEVVNGLKQDKFFFEKKR
jgi:hypothetical protein